MELVSIGAPGGWDIPTDWEDVHDLHDDSHHFEVDSDAADDSFEFGANADANDASESSEPQPTSVRAIPASQITTAARLAGAAPIPPSGIAPDAFVQGMTVMHPEHGPGKIVALSGSGTNRRATVKFATAGERRFVLAHSPLRPAGR
jgi:DNA helicase-2/ATP-dependent DNA helicase PcrA